MSEVYKKSSQYLSNYYNNYDINTVFVHKDENTRIKNAIDNFTNRGLPFWWSITVSRFLLLQSFLESDSDYFVLQDLDNIVINKDLNIRDELTAEWICPWWKYKSLNEPDCFYRDPRNIRKFHNQSYMLSKHKSIDLYTQPHHHVCADFHPTSGYSLHRGTGGEGLHEQRVRRPRSRRQDVRIGRHHLHHACGRR